jgi:hypothetical protein
MNNSMLHEIKDTEVEGFTAGISTILTRRF